MTLSRHSLTGLHGWTTVASLTALMTALVVTQLPDANADAPLPASASTAPVAVASRLAAADTGPQFPTVPARPTVVALPPAAAPVAPPAPPAPPAMPAAPAVKPAAVKPAAPKPAAPKPAAPAPAVKVQAAAAPAASNLCSGAGWEQRRGEAALASLRAGAARTGFTVTFKPARSGYMGMTFLNERRIEMYVRSCDQQSAELLRHVMAHELGHAWDTTQMSDVERTAFLVARGLPATSPWYGCSGCSDFATAAGDFAEVYAQWARGASSNKSLIGGDVGGAQLAGLAQRFFGA